MVFMFNRFYLKKLSNKQFSPGLDTTVTSPFHVFIFCIEFEAQNRINCFYSVFEASL
jgi:hypothetical protein